MAVDAATLNLLQTISKGIESSKEENRNAFSYITNLLTSSNKNNSQFENESKFSFEKSNQSIVTTIKEQNRILKDQYNLIKKYVDFKTKPNQFEKERERTRKETKENNQNSSSRQKQASNNSGKAGPLTALIAAFAAVTAARKAGEIADAAAAVASSGSGVLITAKAAQEFGKSQLDKSRSSVAKTVSELRKQKTVLPIGGTGNRMKDWQDFQNNKRIDKEIQAAKEATSLTQRSPILKALANNKFTAPIITALSNTLGPIIETISSYSGKFFEAAKKFGSWLGKWSLRLIGSMPIVGKFITVALEPILKFGKFAFPFLKGVGKLALPVVGRFLAVITETYDAIVLLSKSSEERKKYLQDFEKQLLDMSYLQRVGTITGSLIKTGATIQQQYTDLQKTGIDIAKNEIQRLKMKSILEDKIANKENNKLKVDEKRLKYLESLGELSAIGIGGARISTTNEFGYVNKRRINNRDDFKLYLGSDGFDFVQKRALQRGISLAEARKQLLDEYDSGKIYLKNEMGPPTPTPASDAALTVPDIVPDSIRGFYENAPIGPPSKTDPDYERKNAEWEAWKAKDAAYTSAFRAKGFRDPKDFIKRKSSSDTRYMDWKQVQEGGPIQTTKSEGPTFTDIMGKLNKVAENFAAAAVNNVSVNNQSITTPTPSYGERYRSTSSTLNAATEF